MRKIRIALALLMVTLLLSATFFTEAEPAAAQEQWQADLLKLMDPADVPVITTIQYENTYAEGTEVSTRDIACEVTVNNVAYGCEFRFEVVGKEIKDWSSVQDWLGSIVTNAAASAGSDSEALAKAIDKAISADRKRAQADENGQLPLYASENIAISVLRVSTPFYPELSVGKNGEATKRLQQRLIELGYLDDKADGYFGKNTKAAVEALEGYIRELEQDLIDNRPSATATPAPTATAVPTTEATLEPAATLQIVYTGGVEAEEESKHHLTLVPKHTAEPTAAPTAELTLEPTAEPTAEPISMDIAQDAAVEPTLAPVTQVDGVADALLQAYIYSAAYQPARRELKSGDSGEDVVRLQRRLIQLGCTTDKVDGSYGGATARAVRIFQYYNGLSQTGVADMETLKIIFSGNAKAPDNSMLSEGSSGEAVKELQRNLRYLGFGNISVDGDYGSGTTTAVKNLQKYMRNLEEAQIRAANAALTAEDDVSEQLTIEVNGVADPLLLDDFYASSFPRIPSTLQNGSVSDDVVRVQRRLNGLEYYYGSLDGSYGAGTQKAITEFQKRHGLSQDGVAGQATLELLFSDRALKALKPYLVKVSTNDQRVYVYGLDSNNEHTVLVKTMKCSTGRNNTPTPKGTYTSSTGPGARWHYFKKFDCWAQYAYYIQGDIMFHSVLYNEKEGRVTQSSVRNLGRKASHGCVRLSVEDAKWLYNHCPRNTTIIVY